MDVPITMGTRNPDREAWIIAWAIALLLHVAIIFVLVKLPMVAPSSAAARQPVRVRLVSETPQTPGKPQYFTELPPDRADKAPKQPEFLSNVNSRARDLAPGGSSALPRMKGEADVPMVNLESGKRSSPASSPRAAQKAQSQMQPLIGFRKRQTGSADGGAELLNPSQPGAPGAALDGSRGAGGASDINQPEMDNPEGNAELRGDVSLSTTAWDYAPWLQRFGRKLMDRWVAPTAYRMGLLRDGGWTVVELHIARSGEVLLFQPLESRGHPSLIVAAQSALRNTAPAEPLPSDFPDSTLTLRVRMFYPRIPSQ